jgi:hypothetical protein
MISGYGKTDKSRRALFGEFSIWWKILFEIKDANIRLHSILQSLRRILKSLSECKISFGI